jgi:cytoskeletal protein CcmA (bactofilin family)
VGGEIKAVMVEASGEIEADTITTTKGVKARRIRIKGGKAKGTIVADEIVVEEDSRVDDVYADSVELRRDSSARNVYAADIRIESGCSVSGDIQYTNSLRAERNIDYASEPKKVEKLPGFK